MADPSLERLIRDRDMYAVDVDEVSRILALPAKGDVSEAVTEDVSRQVLTAEAWQQGQRLWKTQAEALLAYSFLDGLFAPIGVGWGKAGISLLCADHAYRHKAINKVVLVVPASLVSQTVETVYPMWQKMAGLAIPVIPLAGQSRSVRERWARSGKAGLYLLSYQILSRMGGLELLSAIQPGLVIADEAHYWKDPEAGGTKKFLYFMKHAATLPRFIALSGTMSSKSLLEYHHLISLALGARSPLPLARRILEQWAALLDSGTTEITDQHFVEPLLPIIQWARAFLPQLGPFDETLGGLRSAFRVRLKSAPGVVATGDQEIPNSLEINEHPCPVPEAGLDEGMDRVRVLMNSVSEDSMTPDGDLIAFAIHKYKWLSELSGGFYISLLWPTAESLAERYAWGLDKAKAALSVAQDHHEMSQALAKAMREFLKSYDHPIATPLEAYSLITTDPNQVPEEIRRLYSAIKNADAHSKKEHGRLVERDRKFVRLSSFKVDAAVAWAKEHRKGLIWVWHRGLAVWLLEELEKAGLNPLDCGRGKNDLLRSVGDPDHGGKGDRLCVVSTGSHNEGKNLQMFNRSLYLEWSRPEKIAEQSIGRTHRNGQKADTVYVDLMRALPFDHICFAATLNDAIYVQTTLSARRKVLTASHVVAPQIYSPEFLAVQGAEPQKLTPAMKKELALRFGKVD